MYWFQRERKRERERERERENPIEQKVQIYLYSFTFQQVIKSRPQCSAPNFCFSTCWHRISSSTTSTTLSTTACFVNTTKKVEDSENRVHPCTKFRDEGQSWSVYIDWEWNQNKKIILKKTLTKSNINIFLLRLSFYQSGVKCWRHCIRHALRK